MGCFHIGPGTRIEPPHRLEIGSDVYIGKYCTIECNGSVGDEVLRAPEPKPRSPRRRLNAGRRSTGRRNGTGPTDIGLAWWLLDAVHHLPVGFVRPSKLTVCPCRVRGLE